jgi:hypothetical protein
MIKISDYETNMLLHDTEGHANNFRQHGVSCYLKKLNSYSMKNYLSFSLMLLAWMALLVTGCKEDKLQSYASSGVIVRSVMENGVPVYALIQQVQSNTPMDTAVVTDPTGSTYGLVKHNGNPYDFRLDPALGSYSTNAPKDGSFTYMVKFNTGEQVTLPNSIVMPYILPAQNIAVAKDSTGNSPSVVLTWNAVPNAEAYSYEVTLDTCRILRSHQIFYLDQGTNGSIRFPMYEFTPYSGKTIRFKIIAYDLIANNSAINSTSWATVDWIAK